MELKEQTYTKTSKSKIVTDIDLSSEALILFPIIHDAYSLHLSGNLAGYDLVGIYVLSYLAIRRNKSWSNGKLKNTISSETKNSAPYSSVKLSTLSSNLLDILNLVYLSKKLSITASEANELTVMDIFDRLQFAGIKHNTDNYINRCIVNWALCLRPIRLLFHIPTPMEVLRQQAEGDRVVTMFTTLAELSTTHKAKLAYMRGMIDHCKDPLEFLIHDLKHMENFIDPIIYREQVGFFRCMLSLNNGKPKSYFLQNFGYDSELWTELEYVISDMNCYSTHLLRYLYAKMFTATRRKVQHQLQNTGTESVHQTAVKDVTCDEQVSVLKEAPSCIEEQTHDSAETNTTTTDNDNTTFNVEADELMSKNWHTLLHSLGMTPIHGLAYTEQDYVSFIHDYVLYTETISSNDVGHCVDSVNIDTLNISLATSHSQQKPAVYTQSTGTTQLDQTQQQYKLLCHYSYHAAMSLISISSRKRSEWCESEAECVRLYFKHHASTTAISNST